MARTLVQALEGISFPCERSRIVEYARQHDIAPRSLEFLERLPDQRYEDLTALFRALPPKSQRRPRFDLVEERPGEAQEAEKPTESRVGPENEQEQPSAAPWMPTESAEWQPAFHQGANQLVQLAAQWQRFWFDYLNRSMETVGQMLSTWMRR